MVEGNYLQFPKYIIIDIISAHFNFFSRAYTHIARCTLYAIKTFLMRLRKRKEIKEEKFIIKIPLRNFFTTSYCYISSHYKSQTRFHRVLLAKKSNINSTKTIDLKCTIILFFSRAQFFSLSSTTTKKVKYIICKDNNM